MKYFTDLSREEVLGLTEEQIQYYKDLHLAEHGWSRPGPDPVKPVKPVKPAVATRTVYRIREGGFNRTDVCFLTAEAAMKFLELEPWIIKRDWQCDTNHAEQIRDGSVTPEEVADQIDNDREALKTYQRELKAYDDERKERRETLEAIGKLDDEIVKAIEQARQEERARQRIRETYQDFLALANKDHSIAMRFLRKKHSDEAIEEAGIVIELPGEEKAR